MLMLHLDLPQRLADAVIERAAAHGTTPELYLLALVQRVMLEESLAPRHGRRKHNFAALLRDDVASAARTEVSPTS